MILEKRLTKRNVILSKWSRQNPGEREIGGFVFIQKGNAAVPGYKRDPFAFSRIRTGRRSGIVVWRGFVSSFFCLEWICRAAGMRKNGKIPGNERVAGEKLKKKSKNLKISARECYTNEVGWHTDKKASIDKTRCGVLASLGFVLHVMRS